MEMRTWQKKHSVSKRGFLDFAFKGTPQIQTVLLVTIHVIIVRQI